MKFDWEMIGVWLAVFGFCMAFWTGVYLLLNVVF